MQKFNVVELVSEQVVEEFDDLNLAYEKRDELQAAALVAGFTYTNKRYGIRLE
jgi:hypothetical protein